MTDVEHDYPLGPRPTGLYEVELGPGLPTAWMTGDEYVRYAAEKLRLSDMPEGRQFDALCALAAEFDV